MACRKLRLYSNTRAVARALIGGGGGDMFIYSCSARLISFEINLKTTDFKRNPSGITRIYEYPPPPPPINALATALSNTFKTILTHAMINITSDKTGITSPFM